MVLADLLRADPLPDPLDRYVERNVHGGVEVPADVERVVLDPCYRGTRLAHAAADAGLVVGWHPGFVLSVEALAAHADYRGPDVVALAAEVAEDGLLSPAILGRARGRPEMDPQRLKRVWHCLARFGRQENTYG